MLLFLYLFLFLLLMLDISFDYVFIYSYGANKISSRPKMIAPVWLLFQLGICFKQLYGQFAFQYSHHLRNRYFRWNRHHKMDVVDLHTHFLNLTLFPFTQHSKIRLQKQLDLSRQYPKSIFGDPYNVVITFIDNMRQLLVLTHVTNIGIASRTLPPSRRWVFKLN